MATPSVLTVPSMYGDGILYSGPTVFSNELVTNGNFKTDTDWTKGAGVTISNGNANFINAPNVALYQNIGTQSGFVRVEFNITEYTSGTLNVYSGGNQTVASVNVVGNKIGRYTAKVDRNGGNNNIIFGSSDNFTGSITNVSVKEITQGSDFEFTRSTTGTRINEEGYIEDVPYNLVNYSEQLDNAYWVSNGGTRTANQVIAPDGTLTADKFLFNAFASGVYTSPFPAGTYTMSIFIKPESGDGLIRVGMGLNNSQLNTTNLSITNQGTGIGRISSAANGFYRFVTTFTTTSSTTANIYNLNTNTVIAYIWGVQIVKGDQPKYYLPTTDRVNLPRLNYPVYGGCPSLLVEPQRTNSITYSNDFLQSTWGGTQGLSVTLNNAVSPEGILNAATVTQDGTNPNPALATDASITIGQTYTFSMFVKNVNLNGFVRLSHVSSTATGCWFNLDDGTIGTVNSVNATIEKYPNNWYRITNTFVATNSGTALLAFLGLSDTNGTTPLTGSNQSVLAYGAQLELGSYATSYIPTSGSTVTRNEDKAINSGLGTTDTFNDDEGVLFIETEALVNNTEARGISINAGNGQNRVLITYPNTGSSRITGFIQSTAGGGLNANIDGIDTTQKHKVALKYKLNDCAVFIDGVKRIQANSVAMPVGLDRLHFSNGVTANSAEYRGNLNAIAVYKTALTDTELANLTSYNNHDLFIPYRSRMQMIGADQELQCTEHDITRFL